MPTDKNEIIGTDPFKTGTVLEDKFRLDEVLGRGAMGVVYLGYDIFLERKVAIKVLKGKRMSTPEAIERFRREAVTMATVNNNNVVKIYSFGEKEGNYYFVMEYIQGHNLSDFIEDYYHSKDLVPLDVAIGLISQICSGLSAVHKKGIAHRDVKPANVMISKDTYHVSLTDFGLTSLSTSSKDKFVEGTPLYLAPERIRGEEVEQENLFYSDIYSVGCIFFELLTGHPPFECDNIVELLGMHLHEPIPRVTLERPDIPVYIDEIIEKAMAKKLSDRYFSCDELKKDLLSKRMPQIQSSYQRPFAVVFNDGKRCLELTDYMSRKFSRLNLYDFRDQEEAISICQKEKPDVAIICFVENERYSTLELVSILSGYRIPMIMYMSENQTSMRFLYKDLGVAKVITTPAEFPEIIPEIEMILGH
ncbi:protein kinase [Myxococcota bacterium]|nr:protein kinase [Myxococcota bacterium]MBU1380017.1 protein kinase [Myxococcota bacterium]MBU1496048.1 protein kinase [Myxococcota bacterium]